VRPGIPTITDILLEAGVVGTVEIDAALARQRATGTRIGEALVELGHASESDIGWALARQSGYTFLDLSPDALDAELVRSFPEALLRRHLAVPLVRSEGTLSVAFGDFTRGYLIVDRAGVTVLRDPYSAKPYVLFYTTKRVGGGVQDYDAIKLLKFAVS